MRKSTDVPTWVEKAADDLKGKRVMMYCTGGVRCERVSQLVQTLYPTKQVYQLQGGIQTYLKEVVVVDEKESSSSLSSSSASSSSDTSEVCTMYMIFTVT